MDATQPRPPRDESHDDPKVRCPYCHDALTGGLAGDCAGCGTRHHLVCFADHGGCSTHGCGSTRASTAATAARAPAFTPRSCPLCRDAILAEAMVARCASCSEALHVDCYERVRSCKAGPTTCAGPIEVMPHAEAVAADHAMAARGLLAMGATFGGLVPLLLAATGGQVPVVVLAVLGGMGSMLLAAGAVQRWQARRLRAAPPRSRPGPTKL